MSGRDLLLAAVSTASVTPVPIPELPALDGNIFVRVMTAGERQLYAETAVKAQQSGVFVSDFEIVAVCACEADGTPMFHTREANGRLHINSDAIARLVNVDGRAIAAIARKALEVSGLDLGAADRAKKDSASSQSDASSSDSQLSMDEASAK
jgi:hypothetical protein